MNYFIPFFVFLLGLGYVCFPIPTSLDTFTPFSPAKFAQQAADTKIYYTNSRREAVTDYYSNMYQQRHCQILKVINPYCYIKPFKINHNPTLASSYLSPQIRSTYLEEYFYPLTDSLIVSGYEPYDEKGKPFDKHSEFLVFENKQYNAEIAVRYISSLLFARVFVYVLIWVCGYLLVRIYTKFRVSL